MLANFILCLKYENGTRLVQYIEGVLFVMHVYLLFNKVQLRVLPVKETTLNSTMFTYKYTFTSSIRAWTWRSGIPCSWSVLYACHVTGWPYMLMSTITASKVRARVPCLYLTSTHILSLSCQFFSVLGAWH